MSSSILLKIAGTMLLLTPIGHTQMYRQVMVPGLRALGEKGVGYAAKVSWNQANGYFIVAALLCFKWANEGLRSQWDQYLYTMLMITHVAAGGAYASKGIYPPTLVYWGTSTLMGIAAARGI